MGPCSSGSDGPATSTRTPTPGSHRPRFLTIPPASTLVATRALGMLLCTSCSTVGQAETGRSDLQGRGADRPSGIHLARARRRVRRNDGARRRPLLTPYERVVPAVDRRGTSILAGGHEQPTSADDGLLEQLLGQDPAMSAPASTSSLTSLIGERPTGAEVCGSGSSRTPITSGSVMLSLARQPRSRPSLTETPGPGGRLNVPRWALAPHG